MATSKPIRVSDEALRKENRIGLWEKINKIVERECPRQLSGGAHEEFYMHFKGKRIYCVDRRIGEQEFSGCMALSPGQRLLLEMKES